MVGFFGFDCDCLGVWCGSHMYHISLDIFGYMEEELILEKRKLEGVEGEEFRDILFDQ